jgi:hypothetical protein
VLNRLTVVTSNGVARFARNPYANALEILTSVEAQLPAF